MEEERKDQDTRAVLLRELRGKGREEGGRERREEGGRPCRRGLGSRSLQAQAGHGNPLPGGRPGGRGRRSRGRLLGGAGEWRWRRAGGPDGEGEAGSGEGAKAGEKRGKGSEKSE